MHHCEYFFLYFHEFALQTVSYEVQEGQNSHDLTEIKVNAQVLERAGR